MNAKVAYSRAEAAEACGVSLDTIATALKTGKLRSKRLGKNAKGEPAGKHLITAAALAAWVDGMDDA